MESIWDNPALDEELERHIACWLSGARTALAMGLRKNQVVGRAWRKKWKFTSRAGRNTSLRSGGKRKPRLIINHVFPYKEATVVPEMQLSPLNLTFLQLKDSAIISECRFITAEFPTVTYCGLPVEDETSWCLGCQKIVYQKRAA